MRLAMIVALPVVIVFAIASVALWAKSFRSEKLRRGRDYAKLSDLP